ncbi:hypothetical protein GGR51DRAFT_548682 [Nemania sp. FL0031]|nr:hypothetical protein GGR51DRAFT_548682 [Nemania sp. FL0031]
MDGDLGYHLMSTNVPTNVPPELMMIHRNQHLPHRKQAKTSTKTSTSTPTTAATAGSASGSGASAAGSSPTTTSPRTTTSTLPVSPPIIPSGALDDNNFTTNSTGTDAANTNTNNTDTHASTGTNFNLNLNPHPKDSQLTLLKDTATAAATPTTAPTSADLDHDHGRNDRHRHESDDPASPEQSTSTSTGTSTSTAASSRHGFGDHRSWLFGRSSRRRTSSLTKASTSSADRSASPGPSHSDHGLPVALRATTATVPSPAPQHTPVFASPPITQSPAFPKDPQSSSHSDDIVAPRQSHTSLIKTSWRDPFHRRSTHQSLLFSPPAEPLASAAKGSSIHGHHSNVQSSTTLNQAPHHTQHPIPGDASSPGSSPLANPLGVMSNEPPLSSSAERSGALSTASNATSTISKPPTQLQEAKAFIVRNGRTYINDATLPYPLPVDLAELHRQSLRTLLMFQLFGGPILSSAFASKPPTRVLDVGCGAGFWSMMCHRYFAQHGHASISFTGLDIVPLGGSGAGPEVKPDKEMRWRFVQHDIRQLPWPFEDGEFDLVMYLRVLKPGGVLEYWETDSTIRMLRPHAPKIAPVRIRDDDDTSSDGGDDEDNAERMGAYVMTTNTPISAPLNTYLVEYNGWSSKALEVRGLSAVPCTLIGAYLLQEAESLTDVHSKRLAVPLSEIRWEREGVGGVVTKDGKSYIDSQKGKLKDQDWKSGSPVTPAQSALRRTALETTVSFILSLEPLLREVSGKSQEEWDTWAGKMTNDLLREGGTSWGECLEVGVWTSRKRHNKL